eukprot:Colp12_sorted_trinity150504_noHs@25432
MLDSHVALEDERGVGRDAHAFGAGKLGRDLVSKNAERRVEDESGRGISRDAEDREGGLREDVGAHATQQLREHIVLVALRSVRRGRGHAAGHGDRSVRGVVLHGAVAHPGGQRGEADLGLSGQEAGKVLHHALQASGLLEQVARGVCVLGVHELRHVALGLVEHLHVGVDAEQQVVNVAREGAQAGGGVVHVALRVDRGAQQRVQLVVLHVDGHLAPVRVHQAGQRAHALLGESVHREGVHVQVEELADAEHRGERVEAQAVRVLEEHDVAHARVLPLACRAGRVHQRVHVTVAVGLRVQLVRRGERDVGRVREKCGHLALLEDGHLLLLQAEVVLRLQQLDGLGDGVVRDHDRQGQLHGGVAVLGVQNLGAVKFQVRSVGHGLTGQGDLHAAVAEALAQTTSNQNKTAGAQVRDAGLFVSDVFFGDRLQLHSMRNFGSPALEGILSLLGTGQELSGVLHISHKSAIIRFIELFDLGEETVL